MGGEGRAQCCGRDGTGIIHRQPRHVGSLVVGEPLHRIEDRMMLDGSGNDASTSRIGIATCPVDALDGEIVALGTAGGEDHLGGSGAQGRGDGLP